MAAPAPRAAQPPPVVLKWIAEFACRHQLFRLLQGARAPLARRGARGGGVRALGVGANAARTLTRGGAQRRKTTCQKSRWTRSCASA
jgi:hypothetical protein